MKQPAPGNNTPARGRSRDRSGGNRANRVVNGENYEDEVDTDGEELGGEDLSVKEMLSQVLNKLNANKSFKVKRKFNEADYKSAIKAVKNSVEGIIDCMTLLPCSSA